MLRVPNVVWACHDVCMADKDTVKAIAVPLLWVGIDDLPVQSSNQVMAQVDQDQIYLSFGLATPPALIGNADQVREQASKLSYVPVHALSRFAVSRRHLTDLIDLLQRAADNFDQQGE